MYFEFHICCYIILDSFVIQDALYFEFCICYCYIIWNCFVIQDALNSNDENEEDEAEENPEDDEEISGEEDIRNETATEVQVDGDRSFIPDPALAFLFSEDEGPDGDPSSKEEALDVVRSCMHILMRHSLFASLEAVVVLCGLVEFE